MDDLEKIEFCARLCHEANRAICESVGDHSQVAWDQALDHQRSSCIAGVNFALDNPDAGPGAQHQAWMDHKVKEGWTHGPVKDADKKTHPALVPFTQLPVHEQIKDGVFQAIVRTFLNRA